MAAAVGDDEGPGGLSRRHEALGRKVFRSQGHGNAGSADRVERHLHLTGNRRSSYIRLTSGGVEHARPGGRYGAVGYVWSGSLGTAHHRRGDSLSLSLSLRQHLLTDLWTRS